MMFECHTIFHFQMHVLGSLMYHHLSDRILKLRRHIEWHENNPDIWNSIERNHSEFRQYIPRANDSLNFMRLACFRNNKNVDCFTEKIIL